MSETKKSSKQIVDAILKRRTFIPTSDVETTRYDIWRTGVIKHRVREDDLFPIIAGDEKLIAQAQDESSKPNNCPWYYVPGHGHIKLDPNSHTVRFNIWYNGWIHSRVRYDDKKAILAGNKKLIAQAQDENAPELSGFLFD